MYFWNELIPFFLFQSLQAVTTRRNCQLDNAEESLHVITTGIIIGILPKRLIASPTDFCQTVKFSPRIAVIDSCEKKKDFGMTLWATEGYFFINPTPNSSRVIQTVFLFS